MVKEIVRSFIPLIKGIKDKKNILHYFVLFTVLYIMQNGFLYSVLISHYLILYILLVCSNKWVQEILIVHFRVNLSC